MMWEEVKVYIEVKVSRDNKDEVRIDMKYHGHIILTN